MAELGALAHRSGEVSDVEQARRLVSRVADSSRFQKSPRLREFLLYVAKCTLEHRLLEVREQVIAERIFNRKPELGGQDSIVRAEARNLRKRLELYFADEGRDEPTIIVMPRGGYSLAFIVRTSEQLDFLGADKQPESELQTLLPTQSDASTDVVVKPSKTEFPHKTTRYKTLAFIFFATTFIFAGLALFWYLRDAKLRMQIGEVQTTFPLAAIFNDRQSGLIVTSDTGMLQISSMLLRRRVSLDEYVSRNYPTIPPTNPPNLLQNWNIYEFTDGREMTVANLLLSRNARFANHISLRSGHAVQLQDFKENNVVLIGSPISNPWAQLYEDKLNFPCELAADGRIVYRNRRPHRNEQDQFPSDDDIQHHRTYARLAFLPATTNSPAALLIAGTTAQSTQSAGELAVDQARLSRALRGIGIDPFAQPRFFELLIRLDNFVGGAILPEVVAWRLSPAVEH